MIAQPEGTHVSMLNPEAGLGAYQMTAGLVIVDSAPFVRATRADNLFRLAAKLKWIIRRTVSALLYEDKRNKDERSATHRGRI